MNWLKQVHGARVVEAPDGPAPEADGQWTRERHRPLALLTADCLPVVLATEDARCVGIAHAGWRGLAAGVLESLVSAMPVRGASVVAWLGPAISAAGIETFCMMQSEPSQAPVRRAGMRPRPGAEPALV